MICWIPRSIKQPVAWLNGSHVMTLEDGEGISSPNLPLRKPSSHSMLGPLMIQMSSIPSKLSSSKSDKSISPIDIEHPVFSAPASLAISTESSKTEIETSTMDEMLDALELLDLVNEAWLHRKDSLVSNGDSRWMSSSTRRLAPKKLTTGIYLLKFTPLMMKRNSIWTKASKFWFEHVHNFGSVLVRVWWWQHCLPGKAKDITRHVYHCLPIYLFFWSISMGIWISWYLLSERSILSEIPKIPESKIWVN